MYVCQSKVRKVKQDGHVRRKCQWSSTSKFCWGSIKRWKLNFNPQEMYSCISHENSGSSHQLPWLSPFQAEKSRLKTSRQSIMTQYRRQMKKNFTAEKNRCYSTSRCTHTPHWLTPFCSRLHFHTARRSIQSSWRLSHLIHQESFGSNYCHPMQVLLSCVSETAIPRPDHIPLHCILLG